MMTRLGALRGVAAALALLPAASAANELTGAPEPPAAPVSFGWGATFASKYLFLGTDQSDGNPVFQPEVSLSLERLSATLWINYDVDVGVSNEVDFILQYGWEIGRLSVTPGYAYFRYPNRDWDPSREITLDLAWDGAASPSLSLHHDFDAGHGTYATLGVAHEIPWSVRPVSVGTNLFYQDRYYGQSGFPAWELGASVELPGRAVTLSPSISYFHTFDNGDFSGDAAVPSTWLFAIGMSGL